MNKKIEILAQPVLPLAIKSVRLFSIIGESEYNILKNNIVKKANNHCMACGEHVVDSKESWLTLLEIYDIDKIKKEFLLKDVVCVCEDCYHYIDQRMLFILVAEEHISRSEYNYILQRGNELLESHGLEKITLTEEEINDTDWYVLYNNKKYSHRDKFNW